MSFCLIGLLTISSHLTIGQDAASQKADDALRLVLTRLQAIQRLSYDYYREVNYVSENYRNELAGNTFIDFLPSNTLTGFRFQLDNDTYKQVYDGSVSFTLNKKEKTMDVKKQPKRNDFASLSFFVNSPVSFKPSLESIIADKTIAKSVRDTVMNNEPCQLIRFTLPSKTIGNLGTITPITSQRAITYSLFVKKKDGLLLQVVQTNNVAPTDYVLTRFANYRINSFQPEENTWHYFMHVNEYRITSQN